VVRLTPAEENIINSGAQLLRHLVWGDARLFTASALAEAARVADSTITNLKSKSGVNLWEAILERALDQDHPDDDELAFRDRLLRRAREVFASQPGLDAWLTIGREDFELVLRDDRIFSQMLIWALSGENDRVRRRLKALYDYYDDDHAVAWNEYLDVLKAHFGRPVRRPGFSAREVMVVMTSLVEGLRIRHQVDPGSVPDDLFARALVAFISAVVDCAGDGEEVGAPLRLLPPAVGLRPE
jgi:hypothetical protein